jgi:hypothetical protein
VATQFKFGHAELDQMILDANNWQPEQQTQPVNSQDTLQNVLKQATQPKINNQMVTE